MSVFQSAHYVFPLVYTVHIYCPCKLSVCTVFLSVYLYCQFMPSVLMSVYMVCLSLRLMSVVVVYLASVYTIHPCVCLHGWSVSPSKVQHLLYFRLIEAGRLVQRFL